MGKVVTKIYKKCLFRNINEFTLKPYQVLSL